MMRLDDLTDWTTSHTSTLAGSMFQGEWGDRMYLYFLFCSNPLYTRLMRALSYEYMLSIQASRHISPPP